MGAPARGCGRRAHALGNQEFEARVPQPSQQAIQRRLVDGGEGQQRGAVGEELKAVAAENLRPAAGEVPGHADLVLPTPPTDDDWSALDSAFDPPRPNPATMRADDA